MITEQSTPIFMARTPCMDVLLKIDCLSAYCCDAENFMNIKIINDNGGGGDGVDDDDDDDDDDFDYSLCQKLRRRSYISSL